MNKICKTFPNLRHRMLLLPQNGVPDKMGSLHLAPLAPNIHLVGSF